MPLLSTDDEKRKHCLHLFNVPINATQNKQQGNWFLFVFGIFLGAERQRHEKFDSQSCPPRWREDICDLQNKNKTSNPEQVL